MVSKTLGVSFKKYKINPIIRTLILTDFIYWAGNNFIVPIFSIFIIEKVIGGTIEAAGLAATLYLLTRSLAEIPVGMLIDKKKGEVDDLFFLVTGSILQGIMYISFAYVQSVNQLYLAQILLGLV